MHEILALNRQSLVEYIGSDDYKNENNIAITPHRAASQLCNPLVDDADILLILIREQGQLIAYLGMMPGMANYDDGRSERITWLTCLWVAEVGRGQRLSEKLLTEASKLCENKMLLGDYVPFTRKIYDHTGLFMDEIYSKHGLRWYILSDLATILPPKHSFFIKIRNSIEVADALLNVLLTLRQKVLKKPSISYEEIIFFGPEEVKFINSNHRNDVFRRTAEEINWMLANPWVINATSHNDKHKSKYYFSSSDLDFRYLTFVVRDKNSKIKAIAIFSKRNTSLKLPYFYYDDEITDILRLIESTILKFGIKTFTTYDTVLAQSLIASKSSVPIYSKRIQRNYRLANYYKDKVNLDGVSLMQDGEGDCGFT